MTIFNTLLQTVDLKEIGKLKPEAVRAELSDVISEIVAIKNYVLNSQEQARLVEDICNDILGLGPLEPLLARDDIADIMVNGAGKVDIEAKGKMELTPTPFRDTATPLTVSRRLVSVAGPRVDESSPICDARPAEASRVTVIAPPLSI